MSIKPSYTLFHQYYMAQLFSNGTIKSSTEVIGGYNQEHSLPIIQKLYEDFQKGLMKNETAYEQTFNQLFFVELLGYIPNENLRPKAGTPIGGKIADVALGVFPDGLYMTDGVQIAVELKDCTVQLDKRQARTDTQTPVEQGFGYKTSFKNCGWLIVSNFFVTRLYRDNKQDYEEWTLEQLLDPAHDYFQLRKLILLLHKSRLLKSSLSNESFTEKLLSQFRIEQQNITKKFYKEYKNLRFELINDIRQHNSNINIETAVEKAQKIIDRIVFIHFCEDRGLLPDGKLKENVYRAAEADFTPWEVLKKFFKVVDNGSEKLGIPHGYNGELFKPDIILDSLHVGDSICKKFIEIGNYDFAEELSVTILGHIFEQSISDIENLKIDLLGQETETEQLVEKKESKRKKDGIFYTPEYIVDYIVENSLMKYLSEKEDECLDKVGKRGGYKTELEAYQAYQHILQNIKVVDPACGSGAFLVKVFDRLLQEHERVGEIISRIKGMKVILNLDDVYKNILTNNIYGVDLNAESVEITKLSLWLKSAQKGKKLNNLDKNIKCGNSLIDDLAVAGDKAFNWEKEFPQVFSGTTPTSKTIKKTTIINGRTITSETGREDEMFGFDVVVGNPPYVDSETMTKFAPKEREYISEYYHTAKGNWDLYIPFIEQSFNILKYSGKVSMIVPNKRLSMSYGTELRKYITNYLYLLSDFSHQEVFEDVGVFPIVFAFTKTNQLNVQIDIADKYNPNISDSKQVSKIDSYKDNLGICFSKSPELIAKILKLNTKLGDISNVGGAFTTSEAYELVTYIKDTSINYGKKLINTGTIDRYITFWGKDYTTYLKQKYLNPQISCSDLKKYFPRRLEKNEKKKIIISGIRHFESIYDSTGEFLAGKSTSILIDLNTRYYYETITCILNSSLISFFLKECFSSSGMDGGINFSPDMIKSITIPDTAKNNSQFLHQFSKITTCLADFYDIKYSFLSRIKSNLTEKITKKLENFEELSFKDFVAELKKQKITLSLVQQDEREPYFNDYKSRVLDLKQKIQQTDTEIDNMVFDLYGLTEEERKIVLSS